MWWKCLGKIRRIHLSVAQLSQPKQRKCQYSKPTAARWGDSSQVLQSTAQKEIFMPKKRYCAGSNTTWEQVFGKLPIKCTFLNAHMANLIWERFVPIPLPPCASFSIPRVTQFQQISIRQLKSNALLNINLFWLGPIYTNGLTNCHNAHIWSSNILHLSTYIIIFSDHAVLPPQQLPHLAYISDKTWYHITWKIWPSRPH